MTKEQEEAIEILKRKEIFSSNRTENGYAYMKNIDNVIETVLSILKEKDEEIELYGEARRVFGKREMLWNIQRQILGAKQKGKTINEEWLIKTLNEIEYMQRVEEENWNVEQYLDSELERDVIKDSILIQLGLMIKE